MPKCSFFWNQSKFCFIANFKTPLIFKTPYLRIFETIKNYTDMFLYNNQQLALTFFQTLILLWTHGKHIVSNIESSLDVSHHKIGTQTCGNLFHSQISNH